MKKKVFLSLLIVALVITVGSLSAALYHTNESLEAAQADIDGMSFTQGEVIEAKAGGVVTASLKSWVYFQDDSFIMGSKPVGSSLSDIFCDLHKGGYMDSCKGDLVKLKYTKQVTIKSGTSEKTYFLIGNYYVADGSHG